MFVIHFFENNTKLLTQLLKQVPSMEDHVKIKGRKGNVSSVKEMGENHFNVYIIFEKAPKPQLKAKIDVKKKR